MSDSIPFETPQESPVPVEFSPKEFMELVENAIEEGHDNVHDFIIESAVHKAKDELPANVVPFPKA